MFVKGEDLLFQITFRVSEHEMKSALACVLANSTYAFQYFYCKSDVWLTVHRNSVWIRKTN